MSQIMVAVLLIFLILILFVPMNILVQTDMEREGIKEALNLAVKTLPNNVYVSYISSQELSEGDLISNTKLDKTRLLQEFSEIFNNNTTTKNKPIKVLVYFDRFEIADSENRWSTPFFFTYICNNTLYYLSSKESTAYYYDIEDNKQIANLEAIYLTEAQKNQIIINKINSIVSQCLKAEFDISFAGGIGSGSKNDYICNKLFNVLDNITFFAVYIGKSNLDIWSDRLSFHNYCVSGFTLEDMP